MWTPLKVEAWTYQIVFVDYWEGKALCQLNVIAIMHNHSTLHYCYHYPATYLSINHIKSAGCKEKTLLTNHEWIMNFRKKYFINERNYHNCGQCLKTTNLQTFFLKCTLTWYWEGRDPKYIQIRYARLDLVMCDDLLVIINYYCVS